MLIGIFTGLIMAMYFYIVVEFNKRKNAVRNAVLSQMLFWCIYVVSSALLLLLDVFSVEGTLVATAFIGVIVLVNKKLLNRNEEEGLPEEEQEAPKAKFWQLDEEGVPEILKKLKEKVRQEIGWVRQRFFKRYTYVLVLCFAGMILMWDKFELYGLSQDEGVYQVQAISFVYGNNANQKDLEEYSYLDETSQEKFKEKLEEVIDTGMHGYYLFDDTLAPRSSQEKISDVSGYYHGVATYSATMALFGKIFGVENMIQIQTLFWALAVLLLYLLLERFEIKNWVRNLLITIYALSPVMIWLGKSSLTEMFLTCLINMFLYYIIAEKKPSTILIALPMVTYAFTHLTLYTLVPILCICLLALYFYRKEAAYLKAGIVILLGFIAGFLFVAWCSTEYFHLNIDWLLKIPFVTRDSVLGFAIGLGLLAILVFDGISLLRLQTLKKASKFVPMITRIVIALILILGGINIATMLDSNNKLGYMTVISYTLLSGIILLPVLVVLAMVAAGELWRNKRNTIISLLFLYCILLYSAVFRVRVIDHYYGDRYLVPFMGIIFLAAAIAVEKLWQYHICKYALVVYGLVTCIYFVPHIQFIVENKDDTRIEWETLMDVAEQLDENSVVIIQDDLMKTFYFPLRDITGAECYPVFEDGAINTFFTLEQRDKIVYLLSNGIGDQGEGDMIYKKNIICVEYEEDNKSNDPLTLKQWQNEQELSLQRLN